MTKTQKYINEAVEQAKKELSGSSISHCSFVMNMEASGATQILAEALLAQAKANEQNSKAIEQLAKSLKPVDACAIKMVNDRI